jgi:hypothetical protein
MIHSGRSFVGHAVLGHAVLWFSTSSRSYWSYQLNLYEFTAKEGSRTTIDASASGGLAVALAPLEAGVDHGVGASGSGLAKASVVLLPESGGGGIPASSAFAGGLAAA